MKMYNMTFLYVNLRIMTKNMQSIQQYCIANTVSRKIDFRAFGFHKDQPQAWE